jgi:hypothetical protein
MNSDAACRSASEAGSRPYQRPYKSPCSPTPWRRSDTQQGLQGRCPGCPSHYLAILRYRLGLLTGKGNFVPGHLAREKREKHSSRGRGGRGLGDVSAHRFCCGCPLVLRVFCDGSCVALLMPMRYDGMNTARGGNPLTPSSSRAVKRFLCARNFPFRRQGQ